MKRSLDQKPNPSPERTGIQVRSRIMRGATCALLVLCGAVRVGLESVRSDEPAKGAIHFTFQPIPFSLDSNETPQRHAPETMAGGVAVFDFDNDGNLDIFFTNGADINTLKKDSAKYSNRLFRNNGDGTFTV